MVVVDSMAEDDGWKNPHGLVPTAKMVLLCTCGNPPGGPGINWGGEGVM